MHSQLDQNIVLLINSLILYILNLKDWCEKKNVEILFSHSIK